MNEDDLDPLEDEEGKEAGLRAALQFAVGEICSHVDGKPMTGSAVSTLTESALPGGKIVFRYSAALALDLRAFAKHGKRAVVGVDDVKLVARKDPMLVKALAEFERAHLSGRKKVVRKKKGSGAVKERGEGKGKRANTPPLPSSPSPSLSPVASPRAKQSELGDSNPPTLFAGARPQRGSIGSSEQGSGQPGVPWCRGAIDLSGEGGGEDSDGQSEDDPLLI